MLNGNLTLSLKSVCRDFHFDKHFHSFVQLTGIAKLLVSISYTSRTVMHCSVNEDCHMLQRTIVQSGVLCILEVHLNLNSLLWMVLYGRWGAQCVVLTGGHWLVDGCQGHRFEACIELLMMLRPHTIHAIMLACVHKRRRTFPTWGGGLGVGTSFLPNLWSF